ncbi:MAG: histidine kinase [Bacteroidota bacterium]
MTTKEKKAEFDDFAARVLAGIQKANIKMAEAAALKGESLIVADKDGNPISVPAKDLLKELGR